MAGDKVQTAGQRASTAATTSLTTSLGIGGVGERDACVERPAIYPELLGFELVLERERLVPFDGESGEDHQPRI